MSDSDNNNFITNEIVSNNRGFFIAGSDNLIVNNLLSGNNIGIEYTLGSGFGNLIYHNMFNNTNQVTSFSFNFWNVSYPLGGNYWSDYNGTDNYSGPNQDIPGSDGVGDTPYWDDGYPLMVPVNFHRRF